MVSVENPALRGGGRVLKQITPMAATKEIEGQIWTKNVSRDNLESAEAQFEVLSSTYNQDNSINIRVHALGQPANEFKRTDPNLEDVYFIALKEDLN